MNDAQRRVLFGCSAVATLALLFPPFVVIGNDGFRSFAGFGFLLAGRASDFNFAPVVDVPLLAMLLIGVAGVGAALYAALSRRA